MLASCSRRDFGALHRERGVSPLTDLRANEVSTLSWPSRIAVAVRCAQRVVGLFVDDPAAAGETRTLEAGIRGAMRVACDRISLGTESEAHLANRIVDLGRAVELLAKRFDERGRPVTQSKRTVSPANGLSLVVATVDAALRTAWSYDKATAKQVVHAANRARSAVGAVALIGYALDQDSGAVGLADLAAAAANGAVRNDIAWLAKNVRSTDAVPERFFELPLWPSGDPVGPAVVAAYRAAAGRLRST